MDQELYLQEIYNYSNKFINLFEILKKKKFSKEGAREYTFQGLLRRIETIQRCVEQVLEIYPIDSNNFPDLKTLNNLTISIQASTVNLSGAIDNIAKITIEEKSLLTKKLEKPKLTEIYFFIIK